MQRGEIASEILAYLTEHPNAQDTLDGVAQWWLLERKIRCQTKAVEAALAELVSKGLLAEVKRQYSTPLYRARRRKNRARSRCAEECKTAKKQLLPAHSR